MIPLLTTTLYFYNYINLINSAQASNAEMEPSITPLSLHFSLTDNIVNPYNFSFVLQTEACRDEDELLIVIHSSTKPEYNKRRDIMRCTWLKSSFLRQRLGMHTKIIFFMGLADSTEHQQRIHYESELYNDIVQVDFIDSYENNTYKAMSFLKWASNHCSGAKLLLKIDDDVLLRTKMLPLLSNRLREWKESPTPVYIGKKSEVTSPNRDKNSKWYLSPRVWPYDSFPTWLQGMVYLLSPSNTALLFQAALRTGYMHTDDVFIGICVNKTAVPGQKTQVVNYISEYADPDEGELLRRSWEKVIVPFFHMPDTKVYLNWCYEELSHASLYSVDVENLNLSIALKARIDYSYMASVTVSTILFISAIIAVLYRCRNISNRQICHRKS